MMDDKLLTCPFCGTDVPGGTAECPDCHENLTAWTRLRYSHAIDYNEALALAREGRLDDARARLALSLQAKEDFAPAHVLLAKISAQQGRWAEAQQSAQRASELLPDDVRTSELTQAIEQSAMEAHQREEERLAASGARSQDEHATGPAVFGPHWLGRYQRDIVQAFAVGVGLTTVMALLVSRLSGKHRD